MPAERHPRLSPVDADAIVVGAGAAGLATAIFLRRDNPKARVLVLDGAKRLGAKILVSGGSRCNVTNVVVSETDFQGGRRPIVRRILRGFPVPETIAFFREIGVPLHEEPGGKLFPDSNRSRDVLDALLAELASRGADLLSDHRVVNIERSEDAFVVRSSRGDFRTPAVVLATGGLSLPKSGSDGAGYVFARALGHSLVAQTPALVPLLLDDERDPSFHSELTGVAHDVALDVRVAGKRIAAIEGAILWTHFGISGPAALDASRFWLRARIEGEEGDEAAITVRLCGGRSYESIDSHFTRIATSNPRASLHSALSAMVPAAVASAVLRRLSLDSSTTVAHLKRDDRRTLAHAVSEWPLRIRDSRGYNFAEVTAGGIPLAEIDPATMESRRCPGLYLTGEILDVDGRIGGFNFQWAWATARIAGRALARRVAAQAVGSPSSR
jgi:predicted Rossmann fold flavoprotein